MTEMEAKAQAKKIFCNPNALNEALTDLTEPLERRIKEILAYGRFLEAIIGGSYDKRKSRKRPE